MTGDSNEVRLDKPAGYGFEFRHQYDQGGQEVIVRIDRDSSLDDALEAFTTFLTAAGFTLPGELDFERPAAEQ